MKRILALLLCVVSVLALCACSKANTAQPAGARFDKPLQQQTENQLQPQSNIYLTADTFYYATEDTDERNTFGTPQKLMAYDLLTGKTRTVLDGVSDIAQMCRIGNTLYFTCYTYTDTDKTQWGFCLYAYDIHKDWPACIYATPNTSDGVALAPCGYTLFYLSIIVLIPLLALLTKSFSLSWPQFWEAVSAPRVLASYKLTFGASFIAACVNLVFGLLIAWVLVRYQFPGKKIVDAFVDLPFALPTAVAGISLTALLAGNGWVGQYFEPFGIQLAFNPNGVVIALIFIGLPFVVRTVQPVLEDSEKELEEAATSLGATRWQVFTKVILPSITPALLTGFAMAFARAIGEYGSVIFIAGNMPMVSEITPLIIIGKLEQYDTAGATAVAVVMLFFSFIMLLVINALQAWQRRHAGMPA